ncbi:MAG: mannose-1-phosphate guanylyltransferase/mannose-6-phosphate isomerase [Acetobacterales bacterium]
MNVISAKHELDEPVDTLAHVYPVVLCGGSGKRLWPMSRQDCPKQFQRLCSDRSMLQETIGRVTAGLHLHPATVLCSDDHRFIVAEHLEEIGETAHAIMCEPLSRNTGPALTAAALMLQKQDPDAIMLVMPADHLIGDQMAFEEAVKRAAEAATNGWLATFGVQPTRPETGYGYIRQGSELKHVAGVHKVSEFIEKPDRNKAERLIEEGGYLWNSGIFMLPVDIYLEEVRAHAPAMAGACESAMRAGVRKGDVLVLDGESFAEAPDISIDYAVMERTDRAAVVGSDMAWSDIGSWHALRDARKPDDAGNVIHGNVVVDEVTNCFVQANGRLVAAIGLDNLVIVDTEDALLISDARRTGAIDGLVRRLKDAGVPQASQHARALRPWGYYQSVDLGDRFQVKHIMVKPGAALSLQMHHHRAEHWVVVNGTASVTIGDKTKLVRENETVHIPLGETHRLENPGNIPMHLIEVQIGPYLGEDDIVRLEDVYGRV